jgi:proteasome assembly chaperone (PAC2) family protein
MKMKKDTEMLKESLNREKTINELLAPLSGKHRKIMKNLLEDVKTEKLQDYFKKFLPQVLNEQNDIKNIAKTIVNEDFYVNSIEDDKIIVTGDKEKKNEENSFSLSEVIELRKLAGINR